MKTVIFTTSPDHPNYLEKLERCRNWVFSEGFPGPGVVESIDALEGLLEGEDFVQAIVVDRLCDFPVGWMQDILGLPAFLISVTDEIDTRASAGQSGFAQRRVLAAVGEWLLRGDDTGGLPCPTHPGSNSIEGMGCRSCVLGWPPEEEDHPAHTDPIPEPTPFRPMKAKEIKKLQGILEKESAAVEVTTPEELEAIVERAAKLMGEPVETVREWVNILLGKPSCDL